ncbi:hypothetical protein GQ42DRAFT_163341 [Ramicandelaber brevisporus]|nr:hypothetical protein GQ42DRAFT_163341 [Ramicandelaber brevisporus]
MTQVNLVRARLLQLIASASDDELFKINDTLTGAGHLDLDRCNKPGSPFPLFDLPLELLEHSAHYLSRREAASMLTANRLFHDVFARVVWRCIRSWQIKESKFQLSALIRYGHLVNQLMIDTEGYTVESIAALVPNVMSVSIYSDLFESNLQAGQLDLLRNLRTVTISIYDLSKALFELIENWINNDSLSGHINAIELTLLNVYEWMNDIMSLHTSVVNKKRVRLSLPYIGQTIPENILVDLASSLTQLELFFSLCTGRYLDSIYRTSNVTFPYITELILVVCCAGYKESGLPGLKSERFPSVGTLNVCVNGKDCIQQNGSPLPTILSHTWPNVTSLRVSGIIKQDDHMYIASALPNLVKLDYSSKVDSYDLADFLPKFKFLQVLTLRDHYSDPGIGLSSTIVLPSEVLNRLRSMKLRGVALIVNMVRFIFYSCPSLMELKIGRCAISSNVVEYANETSKNVNSTVRYLRLKAYIENQLDLWAEFISNFKNLKEILVDMGSRNADYLEKELTERFPCAKVEQYQG